MICLSKKMLFAIEAVLDIAYHAGSGPVQGREITRRQGIPRRYLEQALQQMVRSKILTGVRGPHGGYHLARERRRITIADIVRVVQSMDNTENPAECDGGSELGRTVVKPMWLTMQVKAMDQLNRITIDDLCSDADAAGVISEGRRNLDFSI